MRDDGICHQCCHEPADPNRKDGRCATCGKKAAQTVWLARQVRRIINDGAFVCSHGSEDPSDCKRCRKCVAEWVEIHEPELRARVRRSRPDKVAAANAARDRWLRDYEAAATDEGAESSASAGEDARCGDSR